VIDMNDGSHLEGKAGGRLPALLLAATVGLLPIAGFGEPPAADGMSGEQVVETVCARCHATGVNGAPKIGDEQAWSKRAAQGLSSLTEHALDGIRNMPSHGGNPSLTDLEIERAVTYMVNQSGGHWAMPISRTNPPAERSGEEIVKARCIVCHGTGVGGAPKIGDRSAWIPRLKQGLDSLVRSAIHGHGGMPPRGGMADLTDAEVRNAVIYMFSAPPEAKP
jgi:cytochrome c5